MEINAPDVALVFEGGGMRAAYSSGVLAALLEGRVFTGWVGGISAGSTCTINYLTRDADRARRSFTDFAREAQFGGFGYWLRGKGYFNSEWIYERTSGENETLPLAFQTFLDNPAQLGIGAIRCTDGEMVYWTREDIDSRMDLVRRVRASSTMPLLMPWTTIDGVDYCDGALGPTGGFAYDAARAAGFEKFIVIATRAKSFVKGPQRLPQAFRAALRRYPAVAEGLMARPANYNRSRQELLELERDGKAYLLFPDAMPISNRERNLNKLMRVYHSGLDQGRREIDAIREFAGL